MVDIPTSHSKNLSKTVLVIVGPTASGKSAVSMLVAEKLSGEIISADSRQIYRYMNIGTAKPSVNDRQKIKHYFVDELYPDQEFNAGEYGKRGREIIETIFNKKMVPIVVGGSGLYIRSLIDGFFELPARDNEIRHQLYERLNREGSEAMLKELYKVDPTAASKMIPTNTRRIIRALEVYKLTGIPISQLQAQKIRINFKPVITGLNWERKLLYKRINERVDKMMEQGLVEEVRKLLDLGYGQNLNALQTVGYKEVFQYLNGEISHDRMVELIKQNSRRYAKRQLTWFRADKRICWFSIKSEDEIPEIASKISDYFLQNQFRNNDT